MFFVHQGWFRCVLTVTLNHFISQLGFMFDIDTIRCWENEKSTITTVVICSIQSNDEKKEGSVDAAG
jgi:hypothetical protein